MKISDKTLDKLHEVCYLRKKLGFKQRPDGYSDCLNPDEKLIERYYEAKKELADLIVSNYAYRD